MKKLLYFTLFLTGFAGPSAFGRMNQYLPEEQKQSDIIYEQSFVPGEHNLPAYFVPGAAAEQIAQEKEPGQNYEPAVQEEKQPERPAAVPAVRQEDFNFPAEREAVASGDESSSYRCLLCWCCFFSCSKSSRRVAPAPMPMARRAYEVSAAGVQAVKGPSVFRIAGAEAYRYGAGRYEGFKELTFSREINMSSDDIVRTAKDHPDVVKLVLNKTDINDKDLKEIGMRCQVVAVLCITGCSNVVDIRDVFQKGAAIFPYVLMIQCNGRREEDKRYIKDFVEYNKLRLVLDCRRAMARGDQSKINFLNPVIDFACSHGLIQYNDQTKELSVFPPIE